MYVAVSNTKLFVNMSLFKTVYWYVSH